jgi:hypothetical protein
MANPSGKKEKFIERSIVIHLIFKLKWVELFQ